MKIITKNPLLQAKFRTNKRSFYSENLSDNAYSDKKSHLQLEVFSKKPLKSATPVKRYNRKEQAEHGTERKKCFNRRWAKTSIKVIKELFALFPIRNLFSYLANPFATTSIEEPAKKNYLYNYYKYKTNSKNIGFALKTVAFFSTMTAAEYEWVTNSFAKPWSRPPSYSNQLTPKGRVMNFDNDSQPEYGLQTLKTGKAIPPSNGRANVNAYQVWKPKEEVQEDADTVLKNVSQGMHSPEFQAFVRLVGMDAANGYLRRMLENKIKD